MIPLKSEKDLQLLREGGRILYGIIEQLRRGIFPGMTTAEIDRLAEELMKRQCVRPAFKGYKGFPASVCVSVNEEIVHGIPGARKISAGDIVSLDVGIEHKGFFCDGAVSVGMGGIDARRQKLIDVARNSLFEGIRQARVNNHLSDISQAIQGYVEKNGFSVVREFVGHGIGRSLHEDPEIPNFGRPHQGPLLKSGMVLAIEPMVNMGGWESKISENGWTALTKDGKPSAHFEHTVAVTPHGPEILTRA